MNAKFEKWCEDYALDVEPLTVESRRYDCKAAYKAGSRDAIQSLEVTPRLSFELRSLLEKRGVRMSIHDSERAIEAILSALKEQAK